MNQKLLEAYDVALKIANSLPEHLKDVRAIKNPDKYIMVASSREEFYSFFREAIAFSFMHDEINENITEDIIKLLGENEIELKETLLEQMKTQELKRYHKKADKYLKDNFGVAEDIQKNVGGAYNNRTGYICLNPIFEDNSKINSFDFYLWTVIHELAHAIHKEKFSSPDSNLNKFLTLYWMTHFLPDKVFLKGMDVSAARALIIKNIKQTSRTASAKASEAKKEAKFQSIQPKINLNDMRQIMKIKMEDNIPTQYSDFSPSELWAESFALFTTANKDAKLLMPNMYSFICDDILMEKEKNI